MKRVLKFILKAVVCIYAGMLLFNFVFMSSEDEQVILNYTRMDSNISTFSKKTAFASYSSLASTKGSLNSSNVSNAVEGSIESDGMQYLADVALWVYENFGTDVTNENVPEDRKKPGMMFKRLYSLIDKAESECVGVISKYAGTDSEKTATACVNEDIAWCAIFVSDVLQEAGVIQAGLAKQSMNCVDMFSWIINNNSGVTYHLNPDSHLASNIDTLQSLAERVNADNKQAVYQAFLNSKDSAYIPNSGDLVFCYKDDGSTRDLTHVGIVVEADSDSVTIVEGNNFYSDSQRDTLKGDDRAAVHGLVIKRTRTDSALKYFAFYVTLKGR